MCIDAIYNFKFRRAIFACKDLNPGFTENRGDLPPPFIRRCAEIIGPVLPEKSFVLIHEYCKKTGRSTHLLNAWV